MKIDRVLELLKIERECVTRQSPCNEKSKLCNRNCGECDIAQNDLELIEMYDFVISMIETLIGRSQWISVTDRLPDDASDVLAYYDDGTESRIIPVNYYKGCWYDCVFNRAIDGLETGFIKYWMSLPEPPKEVPQEVHELTKEEWEHWKKDKRRDPICMIYKQDDTRTPIWVLDPNKVHEPALLMGEIKLFTGKPTSEQCKAVKWE